MKKVVLSGFKGDCSGRFYNKFLLKLVRERKIKLVCIDFGEPKNILGIPSLKDMLGLIKEKKVEYLDLSLPKDSEKYKHLKNIDVAFIVTPDATHCRVAGEFLGKAKRIFIDKPVDSILRHVRLLEFFPMTAKSVLCYDHYLAKFYPLEMQIDKWLKKGIIGKVKKIEFRILESATIPSHRISTLNEGMIYDLFSHVLSVITAIPHKWAYPDLGIMQKTKIRRVEVAKYVGCRIHGCSFAKVFFEVPFGNNFVPCIARVGKGVGKRPDKILRITGSLGEIAINIINCSYVIKGKGGSKAKSGKLDSGYAENFLSESLNVQNPVYKIPGVMPFDAGKEILYILDEADWLAEPRSKAAHYPVGSPISEIERIIKSSEKG